MAQRTLPLLASVALLLPTCLLGSVAQAASPVDRIIAAENSANGVTAKPLAVVDDLAFLRRATVDLIGRIPTTDEIDEYLGWPENERRRQLVDKLVESDRFADRWTVFFGDMLRLRANATGGAALTAYVHNAIQEDLPYDELVRRLIATNGKANKTPEVGYILGDNADPYALASVTSQVFLGVRIGCAQCHDHPFDVWTRKDFYGIAAFFGKTRRVESNLTRVVYTTEGNRTVVLWPPEDEADDDRQPMKPAFPFELIDRSTTPKFIQRYEQLLAQRMRKTETPDEGPSLDDLLADAAEKAEKATDGLGGPSLDVTAEAKKNLRKIDVKASLYKNSELRSQLAELITSPRNTFFAESFVNRVWRELLGRGFVEPVDDFRADNLPSHPKALKHLAEEFVANGYSFRHLVRMIVLSDAYAREHVATDTEAPQQELLERSFLATSMRRMLSESLYDSIVVAGHLFDHKYPEGVNQRVIEERVRVMVDPGEVVEGDTPGNIVNQIAAGGDGEAMMRSKPMSRGGYALEDAIELDFDKLLMNDDEVEVDRMQVMSREELEAQRMMRERAQRRRGAKYETRIVKRTIDDNPKFNSAMRMAAPAPAGHFIRVFGQTPRTDLGEERASYASMRQALMMLNGRLTHEASRVGPMEPIHKLLTGPEKNIEQAIRYAYREILTRDPSTAELAEAKTIVGDQPLDGMADLRWVLLNCNEFRFLP